MSFKILMILAALFGVYRFSKSEDYFSKIILLVQIISIILVSLVHDGLNLTGMILFTISSGSVMFHSLFSQEKLVKKIALVVISGVIFIQLLFLLFDLPFGNLFYLMYLVLGCFGFLLATQNFDKELGYTTVLTAHALVMLLLWNGFLAI